MLKFLTRLIVLFLAEGQKTRQKFSPYRYLLIRTFLQSFKHPRGLIINLLGHERFTNTKLRLHGMRCTIKSVGHRGVFHAGYIVALPLEITLGQ